MERREAHVYRLTIAEVVDSALDLARRKGLRVPNTIEGARVDLDAAAQQLTVMVYEPPVATMEVVSVPTPMAEG